MQSEPSTPANAIQDDHLQGMGGWLVVFIVLLPTRVFVFAALEGERVVDLFHYGIHWPLWAIVSRTILYLAETVLPLWIAYVLASKRAHAVMWTRLFLAFSPVTIALTLFHDGPYSLFYNLESRVFLTLFAFAIPWFVYFSKSRRVRNTYMFAEKIMPPTINCPFCSNELELSDSERTSLSLECPECHTLIQPSKG